MRTFDDRMQLVRISGRLPWRPAKGGRIGNSLPEIDDQPSVARKRLAIRGALVEFPVMLIAYLAVVIAQSRLWPLTFLEWYGTVISIVIGCAPGVLGIWLWRRVMRRWNVPPASLSDKCAACTHALTGVSADRDGCVVCPECGAAWRVGERRG